ncbi:unnamed protein product [Candidula unifasciata]|uniref:Uncharacterized protein n=1 Tax=Candidula unifasciata TaxID=100452 RepID=A0A8S3YXF9_9EUPU|nr:unnamed protein product [Candidula unifasciata]
MASKSNESFPRPSEAVQRPVPKKRTSLERKKIALQATVRQPQRSSSPPLPSFPDTSSEISRTINSSASSGSYTISPEAPSPLREYPGQGIGRGRSYAKESRTPQFEAQGPRKKLIYQPEPTPEPTPLPYRPGERPKRLLIPDRRFLQFDDESTPGEEGESRKTPRYAYTDESRYKQFNTGRMKPPCFQMRESMFLSDSSTPGVDSFQFDPREDSPIYQNVPPGHTRLQSAFSSDSSYTSSPDFDSTGYRTQSPVTQTRYGNRHNGVLPTRHRADSRPYYSESDESNASVPYMSTIDSKRGQPSPDRQNSNVFVLTAGTFGNFLQLQNKAAVLFYNSDTNELEVVEDMVRQFMTQNPIQERQVYASVDCANESQLCARERATDTPFFRMYSKGLMLRDAKDFPTLTQRATARYR